MAENKTKLTEAEQIVDENVAQEPAVPATQAEVAQAQEAPVAQDEVVDEAAPAEATEVVEEPAAEPAPETVSIEMTIPADQLAAAVAQVTGDVAVAETAPDAVAEKEEQAPAEEPLVAQETADEVEVVGEEGQGIVEDNQAPTTITEAIDVHNNPGYKVAEELEKKTDEIIEQGVENMDQATKMFLDTDPEEMKESDESKKDDEKDAKEDKSEDKSEKEDEEKLDFSKIDEPEGDGLPAAFDASDDLGDGGLDTSIFDDLDGEEASFEDIVGELDGLFSGSSEDVAQVADSLKVSAKVMDAVAAKKAEDEEDEEAPKKDEDAYLLSSLLDDDEEPLDFDKISDFGYDEDEEDSVYEDASDDDEDDVDEEDEEEEKDDELEESIVRVPCKFPKKSDIIRESRKAERVQESLDGIIYPAGSEPELDEPLVAPKTPNLVEAHEKAIESRRNAINRFRESIKKENAERNEKFREALRSSARIQRSESSNSNSWENNQFMDRFEESQKLDFNRLFEDGFLG